jgi:dihydroneopterin aldolase
LSLTVVKVGGSFARYSRLGEVVSALEQGAGHTVVVPGGGPFADVVRSEQPRIGYDDQAAHRMALLAMAAFGTALASLSPTLTTAADRAAIKRALRRYLVPVWLPLDLLDGHAEIPETWDMTSDAIACWLAGELSAARLVFLKRRAPRLSAAADLAAAGLLDPLTPQLLRRAGVAAWLCSPRDLDRIGPALTTGTDVGRRIEVA